jgi:hypothetical protein
MPNRQQFRPVRADIDRAAAGASRFRNLSHPVQDDDYGILLMFREYQYRTPEEVRSGGFSQVNSASSNVTDTIFLPLPGNIADGFQLRVQRFDQGTTGDVVSNLVSEINIDDLGLGNLTGSIVRGALKNLPGIRGDTIGEMANNISSDLAFLVRRGVDGLFPNQGRNIDAGTGTLVNPKAALSFDGVEMKVHNFDWTLAPKNPTESENLRLIGDTIKRNMLPEYVNTNVVQRAMFKYPSMVDVFFVGLDSDYYFYFKTCMIQQFDINYTPNGMSVLRGGRPATVQMRINMIESDIHTAEDYGGTSRTIFEDSTRGAPFDGTG